jgi:hypothetical protein
VAVRVTIGGLRRDLIRAAFCEYFGIGDPCAHLLIALYEGFGQSHPSEKLRKAVNSHRLPSANVIWESIRVLRSVMEPEAIDRDESGYFLTDTGLRECNDGLAYMGALLAGAVVEDRAQLRQA